MFKRILLLLGVLLTFSVHANLFSSAPKFLTGDDAFAFSANADEQTLSLNWQIADSYYLYKKEISVVPHNAELGEVHFPESERYDDEFFGNVEIFRNALRVSVPIQSTQADGRVEVRYQGCTKGFCYPPETRTLELQRVKISEKFANTSQNTETALSTQPIAEQNRLADSLEHSQLAIFWFFVLGLGLAFTPCVLPMLPLLSAIVIGSRQRPNSLRAFLLSLTYVQGWHSLTPCLA